MSIQNVGTSDFDSPLYKTMIERVTPMSINHPDNPKNPLFTSLQWISDRRVRALSLADRKRIQELEQENELVRAELHRLRGTVPVKESFATPVTPPPASEDDGEWESWMRRSEAEGDVVVQEHLSAFFNS